jgi:hypothetical protein
VRLCAAAPADGHVVLERLLLLLLLPPLLLRALC